MGNSWIAARVSNGEMPLKIVRWDGRNRLGRDGILVHKTITLWLIIYPSHASWKLISCVLHHQNFGPQNEDSIAAKEHKMTQGFKNKKLCVLCVPLWQFRCELSRATARCAVWTSQRDVPTRETAASGPELCTFFFRP
jgi:hypothetical protein